MFVWGYPEKIVEEQVKRVLFRKSDKTPGISIKRVPFSVTFHPKLTCLAKKIKESSKYLHTDIKVKTAFTPLHMMIFRSARNIRD